MAGKRILLYFSLTTAVSSFLYVFIRKKLAAPTNKRLPAVPPKGGSAFDAKDLEHNRAPFMVTNSEQGCSEAPKKSSSRTIFLEDSSKYTEVDVKSEKTYLKKSSKDPKPCKTSYAKCDEKVLFMNKLKALDISFNEQSYYEEPDRTEENSTGVFLKNIFLKDRKGSLFYIMLPETKLLDMKKLRKILKAYRNFSFVPSDEVKEFLGTQPGGLSPFGLMFCEKEVTVILDHSFFEVKDDLNFHPFDQTKTMRISVQNLLVFLSSVGFHCRQLELPFV